MKQQISFIVVFTFYIVILGFTATHLMSFQQVKVRIIKENAALRLYPEKTSRVIKELGLGAEFEVVETIGEWINVVLPLNEEGIIVTGYVHKSFVELSSISPQSDLTKQTVQPKQELTLPERPDREKEAYSQWKREYERAKSRVNAGGYIMWGGFLVGVVSSTLYVLDYDYGFTFEERGNPIYLIGLGAGMVMVITGVVIAGRAKGEVKLLEEEGVRLGYLSAGFASIRGGFMISFKYCF